MSRTGIDVPAPLGDRTLSANAAVDTICEIDMRATGISSVIWATGYSLDFGWVELPIFNARGEPIHQRGVTAARGIYFLGLKRQYTLKSSLLSGVGEDAAYLAEQFVEIRR